MTTFLANRTDGLGMRLIALAEAIALADRFDGKFKFRWSRLLGADSSVHAIEPAPEIFADEFHSKFLTEEQAIVTLGDLMDDRGEIQTALYKKDELIACRGQLWFDPELRGRTGITAEDLSIGFSKISLSPALEAVVAAADAAPLGDAPVGVHLRSGDVVYGSFRNDIRHRSKATPLPLALGMIERTRSQSRDVILFGQNGPLCRKISARYRVLSATEIGAQFQGSNLEAAVFDIVLMSRCSDVFAGPSGFAHAALCRGGGCLIDPLSYFSPADAVQLFDRCFDNGYDDIEPHQAQRAFDRFAKCYLFGNLLTRSQKLSGFAECVRLDPDCWLYPLFGAIEAFKAGSISLSGKFLNDGPFRSVEALRRSGFLDECGDKATGGFASLRPYLKDFAALGAAPLIRGAALTFALSAVIGDVETWQGVHRSVSEAAQTDDVVLEIKKHTRPIILS